MLTWIIPVIAAFSLPSLHAETGVRILMGIGDKESVKWDGGVTARGASIVAVEPWRFDNGDSMLGGNRWKMSTHFIRLFGGTVQPNRPAVANGVVLELSGESESTELQVQSAQGNFSVRLSEIPFGKRKMLVGGRVAAERVATTTQVTNNPEEQDFPAVAKDSSGAVWVAYLEFKHNPEHQRIRITANQLDQLTARTGGDQIFAQRFANGRWETAIAITEPGGDLYRPAIAVDGKGRAWVFWPANQKGNFDLYARAIENGKAGALVRVSSAPGSDIDPVAATDSNGRVWVAWQGWRNGKASIFAATQAGNAFSQPVTVAASTSNEWNPAIAADSAGHVAVAWDSYRNGNYDVFVRTAKAPGAWGAEMPAAASARYEAYPSLAYDPAGTLWMAYEEGAERWGKDYGADESSGVPVYGGRAIRIRGVTKDGKMVETATDVGSVLPGAPNMNQMEGSQQDSGTDWEKPDEAAWKNRGANRATAGPSYARRGPRNTMPRLTADSSGRLWLAFRSMHPTYWNSVGTVWTEYVASYNGSEWTGSVYLHHSDNLLDNRPALVSVKPGELLVIGSSDHRRQWIGMSYMPGMRTTPVGEEETPDDPFQNDLFLHRLTMSAASGPAAVKPAESMKGAGIAPQDKAELASVAALRNYRFASASGALRVLEGEFHRHSEMSMDGGNDGTIIDQYRYLIDGSYMDWAGCCDHDNGAAREYTWWLSQKLTDIFHAPGKFIPMFHYERSVSYPEGHRNVIFAQRGIRPLPRLPRTDETPVVRAPDTIMLYAYLKKFNGIVASHTSATNMGTDWRDNDPDSEPVVEIYQGDRQNYEMPDAPRAPNAKDAIGGWKPKGFVNLALEMGYKLSFEASSDHISTHMSYANLLAPSATREGVLEAFKKRHVYGATDHILAEFTCGRHMMGDAFQTATAPSFHIKLTGTAPFAKVHIIKNNQYAYATSPGKAVVDFTWRDSSPDKGKTSYYYVRGEQADGEIVWVSPMWITMQ